MATNHTTPGFKIHIPGWQKLNAVNGWWNALMKLNQSHQWYFTFKLLRKITPMLWPAYTSYVLRNITPSFSTFRLPDIFTITLCVSKLWCVVTWRAAMIIYTVQHACPKVYLQRTFPWSGACLCPAVFLYMPQVDPHFPKCGSELDSNCERE